MRSSYFISVLIEILVTACWTLSQSPCVPAAKMMVYLEPSADQMACEIATALDESLSGRSIQVSND